MSRPTSTRAVTLNSRVTIVAALICAVTACDVVGPSNPYDPETTLDQQAVAVLRGAVAINDTADDASRGAILEAIRVGILDDSGRRLTRDGVVVAVPLLDISARSEGVTAGAFQLPPLAPGTYTIVVDRPPAQYLAPALPTVRLTPGGDFDVGELRYAFVGVGDEGPGRIDGVVETSGAAGGQHRVNLFRRRGQTTELVASVVTDGAFDFQALSIGSYAVVVDSDGFTPVYRLGVDVSPQESGEARLRHSFAGDDALVVHPVTAALLPAVGDSTVVLDEGLVFVRGDAAPLVVLPFVSRAELELGITGMRLSTDSNFLDAQEQPLRFVPHQATTSVALPAADGPVQIFAQFEARSADNAFVFVSPTVSLNVIRDTTPPSIEDVRAIGLDPAASPLRSRSRTITLAIEAQDATSAVDAVGVAFDVTPTVLDDLTAAPGLQRIARSLTAAADGTSEIVIVVEDRAGNRSLPTRLPVTIDTVLPVISLTVIGADDGFLRNRTALLRVVTVPDDDGVLVAVGLEGAVSSPTAPPGETVFDIGSTLRHGAAVTFEALAIDAAGNSTRISKTVILDLRGDVGGTISSDAVPGVLTSVAGATVTLRPAQSAIVGPPLVVDANGNFQFTDTPEGRYELTASLPGHTTLQRSITVEANEVTTVDAVTLQLLRGEIRGVARRGDVDSDNTAHAGIRVAATLVGSTRVHSEIAITNDAGAYTLRGLPQIVGSERYVLTASAEDYGSASANVSLDAALLTPSPLSLARQRNDFDVCKTGDGLCTATKFFSTATLDVRLRDATAVVAVHVGVNGGASQRIATTTGRATVNIGAAVDGELNLTVQAENSDGSRGEILAAGVFKDTQPPTDVVVTRVAAPNALDARFTNASSLTFSFTANSGEADTAPLAPARVVLADTAPALPQAGFLPCDSGRTCAVPLPAEERLFTAFVFACDAANNCAAPRSVSVVRDVTPPSKNNGADFSVAADGSVVVGDLTILPTPFYVGVINLGTAKTGATPVLADGQPVADVHGFRLSLNVATVDVAPLGRFLTPPVAGEVRNGADIVVPPLSSSILERQIFAQLVDAAGNPSVTFTAKVLVDTSPPLAFVSINNDAPTAQRNVGFTVTVPPGGEVPTSVSFVVGDLGVAQSFNLPLTGSEQIALPDVDGLHRIAVTVADRVGNTARSERSILLDRIGPRVDAVQCVAATCVDNGGSDILTRSATAEIDLLLAFTEVGSGVARVEVTSVPVSPLQTISLDAGILRRIRIPTERTSVMTFVAIDVAGNRGAPFVRAVRHDTQAPSATTFTLTGTPAGTTTSTPQVVFAVVGASADTAAIRVVEGASIADDVPFTPFTTQTNILLSPGDGLHSVSAQLRDGAGNVGNIVTRSVTLDTTPPQDVSVIVNNGAATTSSTTVTLSLTASGASTMQIVTDGVADTEPFIAFASSASATLPSVDGERLLIVRFADAVNNISTASDTILLDRVAPCGSGLTLSLIGNDPANLFSNSPVVPMTITCAANDATSMRLACDGTIDTEAVEAFSSTPTCALADGVRTVVVQAIDRAGNVRATVASDAITVDRTPPSIPRFVEASSTTGANTTSIRRLAVQSTDVGAAGLRASRPYDLIIPALAASGACPSPTFGSNGVCAWDGTTTVSLVPLVANAENRIRVRAVDKAGNVGDEDQLLIVQDSTPPLAPETVTAIAGNATVDISWTAVSDAVGYRVYYGPINPQQASITLFSEAEAQDLLAGTNANEGSSFIDVGNNLRFKLTGMAQGAEVFVGVQAYDRVAGGTVRTQLKPAVPNEVTPVLMSRTAMSGTSVATAIAGRDDAIFVVHSCRAPSCTGAGITAFDQAIPTAPAVWSTLSIPTLTRAMDIEVLGAFAYVGNGERVEVISVADPRNMSVVGGVFVGATTASLDDERSWAFDLVATPQRLTIAGETHTGWLFVASEKSGIRVFHLDNPKTPVLVTTIAPIALIPFSTPSITSVALQGKTIVFGQGNSSGGADTGVFVADVTATPITPVRTGSGSITNVIIDREFVWAIDNQAIELFKINPATLAGDSRGRFSGSFKNGVVAGPYLYLGSADFSGSGFIGLRLVGLEALAEDVMSFREVGSLAGGDGSADRVCDTFFSGACPRPGIDNFTQPAKFVVQGPYLYEANPSTFSTGGFIVRRLARPLAVSEVSRGSSFNNSGTSASGGGVLGRQIVASLSGRVLGIDVSDPQAPVTDLVALAGGGDDRGSVDVVNGSLFVADASHLRQCAPTLEHICDPAAQTIFTASGRLVDEVVVVWPFAFIVDSTAGVVGGKATRLRTIDLRDNREVAGVATLSPGGGSIATHAVYALQRLFISSSRESRVFVVDVSTILAQAGSPIPLATLPAPTVSRIDGDNSGVVSIAVSGSRLYTNTGVGIVSFSMTAGAPTQVLASTRSGLANGSALAASGDLLFSLRQPEATIVDAATLRPLYFAGRTFNVASMIVPVGKHYLVLDDGGFGVVQLQ